MVGIDSVGEALPIATLHAQAMGLAVDYRQVSGWCALEHTLSRQGPSACIIPSTRCGVDQTNR